MKQMLNSALAFAAMKHDGQFDKSGQPYLLHVLEVYYNMNSDDEELNCAAILHDVIEDTDATYIDLRDIGMSERVINIVRLLTKVPGQTYDEYVAGVLSDVDAMMVKQADLTHNMDLKRLKGVSERDLARMNRYIVFYHKIEKELYSR